MSPETTQGYGGREPDPFEEVRTKLLDRIARLERELEEARRALQVEQAQREDFQGALATITGPSDSGPWIEAYRTAGGGYEGLQAIANAVLDKWAVGP